MYIQIFPGASGAAWTTLQWAGLRPMFDFRLDAASGIIELRDGAEHGLQALSRANIQFWYWQPPPLPTSHTTPSPAPVQRPPSSTIPSSPFTTPVQTTPTTPDLLDFFSAPSRPVQAPPTTPDLLDLFSTPSGPPQPTPSSGALDPFSTWATPPSTPPSRPVDLLSTTPGTSPAAPQIQQLSAPVSPPANPVVASFHQATFDTGLSTSVCPSPMPKATPPRPASSQPTTSRPPISQPAGSPPAPSRPAPPRLPPPSVPILGYVGSKEDTLLAWAGRFFDVMQRGGVQNPADLAYNLYAFGQETASRSQRSPGPLLESPIGMLLRRDGGFYHLDNGAAARDGQHQRLSVHVDPSHMAEVMQHLYDRYPSSLRMIGDIKCPSDSLELEHRLDNLVIYYYDSRRPDVARGALRDALEGVRHYLLPGHPPGLDEVSGLPGTAGTGGLASAGTEMARKLVTLYGDGKTGRVFRTALTRDDFIAKVRANLHSFA